VAFIDEPELSPIFQRGNLSLDLTAKLRIRDALKQLLKIGMPVAS
jgi:hypothetical protein